MPQYKLCYFNGRGLAEISRWIFAFAGQEYEDFRWAHEDWPTKYKQTSPTGQGPYLEVDGVKIAQSTAIARYLARQFGVAGRNDVEQALVDMIVGCVDDFRAIFRPVIYEKDEEKKAALLKKVLAEQAPTHFERLENLLKSNNGGDGYFVGDEPTWCDFQAALGLDTLKRVGIEEEADKYPKLKAHKKRVEKLPKISEWLAKRPDTPF